MSNRAVGFSAGGSSFFPGHAGALYNLGTVSLVNTTVGRNTASPQLLYSGGCADGICNYGSLTLDHVTLAENANAHFPNGGIRTDPEATTTVIGSILADPCTGATTSLGSNLSATTDCGLDHASDLAGVAVGLGAVAGFGPDAAAYAAVPLPSSPAIDSADAGTCPAVDQRGTSRPLDGDGGGAVCDRGALELCAITEFDTDADGLPDGCDNCPDDANPGQIDRDHDGIGDDCDICPTVEGEASDPTDGDGDGIPDECDRCPGDYDPQQLDSDGDGAYDACDICPDHPNPIQNDRDRDEDGIPDECDACVDEDGDGYGRSRDPYAPPCECPVECETDCDHFDPDVNPGQVEIPGNGKDDDCDPSTPAPTACNPEPQSANAAVVDRAMGV